MPLTCCEQWKDDFKEKSCIRCTLQLFEMWHLKVRLAHVTPSGVTTHISKSPYITYDAELHTSAEGYTQAISADAVLLWKPGEVELNTGFQVCNRLLLNAQHKSVSLQLLQEQGVNKLKAVHNILDLLCKSKIRVKHSSGMYNVVLDWALHYKRIKHCVFHLAALQQVQMQGTS